MSEHTAVAGPEAITWRNILIKLAFTIIAIGIGINVLGDISKDVNHRKTLELEIDTLKPHKLCGVHPGKRKFTIPVGREISVFIPDKETGINNKTDITSTVRVNGFFPGEEFEVDSNGCVDVSFSVNEGFQKNSFVRQVIAITLN